MNYLDIAPPIIYRLISKLGPDAISARSGLSRSTVQRVSANQWKNVRYGVCLQFVKGCVGEASTKEVRRRVRDLESKGISGLKHLNPGRSSPLHKRGAAGNTKKFLIRVISEQV